MSIHVYVFDHMTVFCTVHQTLPTLCPYLNAGSNHILPWMSSLKVQYLLRYLSSRRKAFVLAKSSNWIKQLIPYLKNMRQQINQVPVKGSVKYDSIVSAQVTISSQNTRRQDDFRPSQQMRFNRKMCEIHQKASSGGTSDSMGQTKPFHGSELSSGTTAYPAPQAHCITWMIMIIAVCFLEEQYQPWCLFPIEGALSPVFPQWTEHLRIKQSWTWTCCSGAHYILLLFI